MLPEGKKQTKKKTLEVNLEEISIKILISVFFFSENIFQDAIKYCVL